MQPVACPRSARCVALKVAPIKKSRASGGLGSTRLDGRLRRNVACGCLLLVLGAWTLPDVAAESAAFAPLNGQQIRDRKSTRLNSSHLVISYAVFCLEKNKVRVDVVC